MFTIEKISITRYGACTVQLSSNFSDHEMTVRLSIEQANEVEKLVREILATELRMPAIKEKLEAAKSVFPPAPIPGSSADVPMKVTETISSADLKPEVICPIHNVGHDLHQDCPMCAEIASDFNERSRGMKPSDRLDDDIPF
jgi:hypothetical protein